MVGFSYTPTPGGRWSVVAAFGLFAVAGVVLIAATVQGGRHSPPVWFTVAWLLAVGWNAYWFGCRVSARLAVRGDTVQWQTGFRSGQCDADDVTAIHPVRLIPQLAAIEVRDGPTILCLTRKGFSDFAAALAEGRSVSVRGPFWETRGQLRSAFKREPDAR